jgi:hypothetical protein
MQRPRERRKQKEPPTSSTQTSTESPKGSKLFRLSFLPTNQKLLFIGKYFKLPLLKDFL